MFDYVIIGAGSAGCVLANRLSEDPSIRVCLLEAGPPDTHPLIHMPLGILWMMRSKVLNWRFHTAPEPQLGQRRMFWPRGRMLGGSSSSNAMCYIRGHAADYDAWAALGNVGWSFKEVLPYFLKAEGNELGDSAYHHGAGPLKVSNLRSTNDMSRHYVQAGIQAGLPFNPDFNGPDQEGVGLFQVTQHEGRRCSAAKAYLAPARRRPNLQVITDAHVTRILLESGRAVGVAYTRHGQAHEVLAGAEVILSAGAVQSPQILMLSGVGDTEWLRQAGVAPVVHLPGVGRNLQDHLDVVVTHQAKQPGSYGITWRNLLRGPWYLYRYLVKRDGMYTTNGAEGCGFARTDAQAPLPDVQLHFTPGKLRKHSLDWRFLCGEGYSLHVCNLRPKSRGEIRLNSADPFAPPDIRPHYLSHPDDMAHMVRGVRLARRILAAPAFDAIRGPELTPGEDVVSDAEIEQFICEQAETIYHPVGTCKMGHDPLAVVDDQLRVHGVGCLRVVDASIMPLLIGGNTNAPTIMIAEKAADLIKADRHQSAQLGHPAASDRATPAPVAEMATPANL
ncbi:choline dehydrogenase-like flavoprotein [Chitinivorax tropicus]|uniref:Choline dehydrogenase-like flavoprotein n=1 Tax=Chitinivorax tropicus TaxID=714531 RepID=A0A840MR04_9PROT|nr:choline dehydrogenase [Chitinivorax tropicus]MBB5017661.1 choline dehydrogenase-like flavoprotein [Chitinivorax tropicus]